MNLFKSTHIRVGAGAPRALAGTRRFATTVVPAAVTVLVAGLIAVPGASAAGGQVCTGTGNQVVPTANPFYSVENTGDAGGSACLTVSSTAQSFHVDSTNFNPSAPGANTSDPYIGFKAIYTGCKNGSCLEPGYPALASSIVSEPTSWTFSSNFAQISGQFDAIYDAFFNTTPTQQYLPDGAEVMVWMNYTSGESALGGTQLPDQTIEGQTYHVWSAVKTEGARTWTRLAFQRTAADKTTSVTGLDMAPFIQAAIADGAVKPTWYQQDLEAGFEIWQGGVGLQTDSFSAPTPTLTAAASSGGSGGSSGTGSSGSSGSSGSGSATSGSSSTAKGAVAEIKPHVSLAMPACSTQQSRPKCNAFRRTAGAWREAYGFASDPVKVTKVVVTGRRAAQKGAKALTITVKAKFISSTAWEVHLGTLTRGDWRFTAVATDRAGKRVSSNTVVEHINVGLAANARIPRTTR